MSIATKLIWSSRICTLAVCPALPIETHPGWNEKTPKLVVSSGDAGGGAVHVHFISLYTLGVWGATILTPPASLCELTMRLMVHGSGFGLLGGGAKSCEAPKA